MSFTPVAASYQDENMSSNTLAGGASKKRKRPTEQSPPKEAGAKRSSLAATNGNVEHGAGAQESFSESSNDFAGGHQREGSEADISTTAAAALTAHLNEGRGLSFGSAGSATDERPLDESFSMDSSLPSGARGGGSYPFSPSQTTPRANGSLSKPTVGSDEWHRVRRDNHKEVERRRRETINEGINELAKIVPGCEKNKGSILARAVSYIAELKQRQEMASEQKSMEKSILEQAVDELTTRNEELKERSRTLEARVKELEGKSGSGGEDED